MKYLLVDCSHLFHRCRHTVRGTIDEKTGLTLHMILMSLGKAWRTQNANHVVFCFDGHSWRKDFYPRYKSNRAANKAKFSPDELAEDKVFYETCKIFEEFVTKNTNTTVLSHPLLEGDDCIAGFIQNHPDDEHVIVSSDADFYQLLAANVVQYNGVEDELITLQGIYQSNGKLSTAKKTGLPKTPPDPAWSLFEKAVRGCSTDYIFPAYPGIREKSTKKKIGMRAAFDDRHKKGFNWHAIMNHVWMDPENVEHKVATDYARNVILVDLTAQPADVRKILDEHVKERSHPKNVGQVGLRFLKFCGQYDLAAITENGRDRQFTEILSSPYPSTAE